MKIVDQLRYFAALKTSRRREADRRDDFSTNETFRNGKPKTTDLSKNVPKIQFISTVLHSPGADFLDEPFRDRSGRTSDFLIEVVAELKLSTKHLLDAFDGNRRKTLRRYNFNQQIA